MAAISSDHQLPMDGAGSCIHSRYATVLSNQTGDAQPGANIGTRRSRGIDERRIECYAPNAQAGV
ncbi:MAG: hypothetical protein QOJ56_1162 [Mycobacterium sp.]|nr:hypothetical protein [Mycobacterium sp.]